MPIQEQQVGQVNPATADTPETLLQVGSGETFIIKGLFITNTAGQEVTVTVYSDPGGTTYDDTTVIVKNLTLPAGQYLEISAFMSLTTVSGTIGVECSVGNGANFTAFGAIIT